MPAGVQPTLCTLPARLVGLRKNLVETGFYLGDNSVLDNVHWVREGCADRLVVKADAAVADSNLSEAQAGGEKASQKYPSPPPDDTEGIELAPLSAIVQISDQDFWMTSDGGYHKPSKIWQDLAGVKLSCTVEEPDPQPVRGDFKTVMDNLRNLQSKISKPDFQPGKGFLLRGGIGGQRLKVRHTLFEPLESNEVNNGNSAGDLESDSEEVSNSSSCAKSAHDDNSDASCFTMEKWPLTFEDTRDELEDLRATHRIVPVPAYDLEGKLIKPGAYRRSLQNALVELHFNLSHWAIMGKKDSPGSDVFTADIYMIRVIAPPRSTVAGTPRKRKISLFVDPSSVPQAGASKKRRLK